MAAPVTLYTDSFRFIDGVCDGYVGENVAAVARVASPFAYMLLSLYVVLWGFSSLRGAIREPFDEFVKRLLTIAIVIGIGLNVANYNILITNTFLHGPEELVNGMARSSGTTSVVTGLDAIFADGVDLTGRFWAKAGVLDGDFGMYIVAAAVMLMTIVVTAYSFFLMALAKVMLTVIICIGPLVFIGLLFEATAGFFNAWLRQMTNYFAVPVLVVLVNLLVMTLFARAADGAAGITSTAEVTQVFPFLAMGLVTLLSLASVLSVASGLAGGVSLSSFGMGRFAGGMLKHYAGGLASVASRPVQGGGKKVVTGGKKVARAAWNAYQNRQRNKIMPTRAPRPKTGPVRVAGPKALPFEKK